MNIEEFLLQLTDLDDGKAPLYQNLADALRKGIHDGLLDAAEALPSERDLSTSLSLSRVTVRKAIQVLVSEGLLVQRQGAGTFIAKRMEQALTHLTSFTEDMQSRQYASGVVWLDRSLAEASLEEREVLRLAAGERIARLYRLRTANEQPMALELAVLPARLVPNPAVLNGSLYEYLDLNGKRPVRATQRLRAVPCDDEQATFLRISTGSPVLYIERHSFDGDGSPVEFTRSHYRGDSYDFVSEMVIKRSS